MGYMPPAWVAAGAVGLITWLCLTCPCSAEPPTDAAPQTLSTEPEPQPTAEALLAQGLALFKEQKYAAAVAVLQTARQQAALREEHRGYILLLLGVAHYRLGRLDQAEELLNQAAHTGEAEFRASARVFLAMVFAQQGAQDRARAEFGNAAGAPYLRDAAERLLQHNRPHRLQLTLIVSPEYDGNVPLTSLTMDAPNFPQWRTNPQASMDGDFLFLGSIGVRPAKNGFLIGDTFSYRQQVRLTDYNLLLNSTWLSYSYFGPADRLRLMASFNFALLGNSPLFLDGAAKAWYRRRLFRMLGLAATYEVHYRDYLNADYYALTGLTQSLQLELGWGLAPEPVSLGLGYQALREQTQPPDPTDPSAQDFRAWGHGPSLWLRARLHRRIELALTAAFLHRDFDAGRIDNAFSNDLSLKFTLKSWLEAFVEGGVIYNDSTSQQFNYVKPTASAGLAVYLGLL